jgi:hypothetical protein
MSSFSFGGNNTKISLWSAASLIAVWVLLLFFVPTGGFDSNWPFYAVMLIPVYGLLQDIVGVFRKKWLSFFGITANLFFIFCIVFAIAFNNTGFGPG